MNRIILVILLALSISTTAQVVEGSLGYYQDALLFGQTNPQLSGTARIQSIGGVQTSLGGDITSASGNPAGLGFYSKSVFSLTPSFTAQTSSTNYFDSEVGVFKNNFNFANLGIVLDYTKGDYVDSKFKGGSLAFSLNRVANYNGSITYQDQNPNNSIIDSFISNAGNLESDLLGGHELAAYENYLINPEFLDNGDLVGYGSFVFGNPRQNESIETSGAQYELNVAYGGNYNDRIYFGGGIGISTIDYRRNRIYTEDNFTYEDENGNDQVDDFVNFINVGDELTIEGVGINGKLGLIVRPLAFLTMGVSYKTPTFFAMDDESTFDQFVSWNGVEVIDNGDTTLLFDREYLGDITVSQYSLRTPGRLSIGSTLFLGKIGFLSGDVEFVDYSTSQLKATDFSVFEDNETIGNLYTSVINYRFGSEFRIQNLRLRGGYSIVGDPYQDSAIDASRRSLSFGAGYRNESFFLDMAFVNTEFKEVYSPYFILDNQPSASVTRNINNFLVTLGFNF